MKKHRNLKFILILILSIGGLYACIKPYDFDSDTYDKVLVVDGIITDEDGPKEVKISYTYPLEGGSSVPVSDATVWVESSDGSVVYYDWSDEGKYLTPSDFKGVEGESYQLFIEMPNGDSFYSSSETLVKAPEIDSIYGKPSIQPTSEGDRNTTGVQFFIDSKVATGTKYFRYEWNEAYKIRTPYASNFTVDENNEIIRRPFNIGICYSEESSSELIYGTSIGSSENRLIEFPVRFISDETPLLLIRYSIEVNQFAISESAYLFYKKLKENNLSGGSLFDRQTGSVFGNVTSDNNQPVLGFFEVSGVSAKRKFFGFRDLEHFGNVRFPFDCSINNSTTTTIDSIAFYEDAGLNLVNFDLFFNTALMHSRPCTDCTYYADPVPPDYWIE